MTTPSPNPDDVTTRLRAKAQVAFDTNKRAGRTGREWAIEAETEWQAANLIDRLRRQLAERDAALKPFADFAEHTDRTNVAYLRSEQPEASAAMTDAEIAALARPDDALVMTTGDLREKPVTITMGQTRAARSALGEPQ